MQFPNTKITYLYRDGSNYKTVKTITLSGRLTRKQIEPYLDEKEWFIPSQVGLEDIQHQLTGFPNSDDHPWHELETVQLTREEPTEAITAEELLHNFEEVRWDDTFL